MTDHLRGALIGLAVGDALGAAVEFSSPGSFAPVTGYRSGGPHGLKAGEWTDDTSMALALADSMASVGWDLNDQARRYVEWWQTGKYSVNGRCFDIGITTRGALSQFVANKDARLGDPPSGPAATAPSCAWPRCRSDTPTYTRISSMNFHDWPTSRACPRTPANNAGRPAGIWRPSLPPWCVARTGLRYFPRTGSPCESSTTSSRCTP